MAKELSSSKKEQKEKVGFSLTSSSIRKLKIISATDDVFQNDIIQELLDKYIADWEKKNGVIKIR